MTALAVAVHKRISPHAGGPSKVCADISRYRPIIASVALANVGLLVMLFLEHSWILTARGQPAPVDFLAIWTTGRLALAGVTERLYDSNFIHQAQIAIAEHRFAGFFYWNYPPQFIFVAMALAVFPYAASFIGWIVLTGLMLVTSLKAILGRWEGPLLLFASPAVLLNAYVGQTGYLTAAVLGTFLLLLPSQPVLAGFALGLLTYKPQFGILIPLALIAAGRWRTMGIATLSIFVVATIAELEFGTATFAGFIHSLPIASRAYLTLGEEGWTKIHSVYSAARFIGIGSDGGWLAQTLASGFCATAVFALWRSRVDHSLKAAGLVTASMLSTPYVHVYDFPILLVAMAFLYRNRPFDRVEWISVVGINAAMYLFLAQIAPIGTGLVILFGGLVIRRVLCETLMLTCAQGTSVPHIEQRNWIASRFRHIGFARRVM